MTEDMPKAKLGADEVIAALRKVKNPGGREQKYQRALANKLEQMGLYKGSDFVLEYRTKNPDGSGRTDLVVTGCEPHLQIEVKVDGDWRHVGEAVVELFSGESEFPNYRKVAAFGGPIKCGHRESLKKMMDRLDVIYIVAEGAG